jgi:exoribonuclease-2|tara:strand:+ start:3097 stop:5103 length:2007 start_codon:yes stop_codon:yes gene_type:complete
MFTLKDNEALVALKKQLQAEKIKLKGKIKTTQRGFGFLETEDGKSAFIQKSMMYGLMPDMNVVAYAEDTQKGLSVTEVLSVKSKGQSEFICKVSVFEIDDRVYANGMPLRNDLDIKIQLGQQKGDDALKDGDIAVIKVNQLPHKGKGKHKGKVIKLLGNESDAMTIWSLIKHEYKLNEHLEEIHVNELPKFNDVEYWEARGYQDLTAIPLCTIDSYSSRDLDDALYVEDAGENWKLVVAIADPTSIIEGNDELKSLLVSRGVTHYLATEIIHLMAKFFSEDNFSLVENEIRPSLVSTIMVSKETGEAKLVDFVMGIVESKAKLSYEQVTEHIRQRAVKVIDDKQDIATSLNKLYELSQARLRYRQNNNLVGLDEKEYFFVIDEGVPLYVKESVKTLAHEMVSEAAIAANVVFAEWAENNGLPIAYISHDGFEEDRIAQVNDYLKSRGLPVNDSGFKSDLFFNAHKILFDKVLESENGGSEYEIALARKDLVDLRGFYKKGEMSLTPRPHRPMGLKKYATWTSPIRKSLDMLNHLVVKSALRGIAPNPVKQDEIDIIQDRSRDSRQAERRLNRLLGASYLKQHEGNVLKAIVTQVLKRAVRVEIEDTGISLVLGINDLNIQGFARLDSVLQSVSVDGKDVLKIADTVDVKIQSVDVYFNEIKAFIVKGE